MTTESHHPSTVTASAQVAPFFTKNQKIEARANIVAAKFIQEYGFPLRFVLEHPIAILLWASGTTGMIVGALIFRWF